MRASLVVIIHIRQQHVTEMPLAEHNNVEGIPVGWNRSVVQHMRFVMGNVATSVNREYPWIEVFG